MSSSSSSLHASQFGQRKYWDETFEGRGDFDSEAYSWYYGWEKIKPVFDASGISKKARILVPGCGNVSSRGFHFFTSS